MSDIKLFYSETDKKLFYIAGYENSQFDAIRSIISTLENLYKHFVRITKVKNPVIKTFIVEESNRYKYMRVIYCDIDEAIDTIPADAFRVGKDWNMLTWIKG
jgi:hypothetical protein